MYYNVTLRRVRKSLSQWKSSITYSEFVFIIFGVQQEMCMHHIFMCPARFYSVFPRYLIYNTIFEKKVIEQKIRVLIVSTTFV
jgi:hypothetical protein